MAAVPVVRVIPGALNLELYRGDTIVIELTIDDGATSPTPLVLPTTGWTSDIKEVIGGDVLASFTVDGSAGASGVLTMTLPKASNVVTVDKCVWDLQCSVDERTYLAGKVTFSGEVTLD